MKLFPNDLFELIRSLSKAEKSFIRKASGDNSNAYLQLFTDLEKLKDYDEKAFLKKNARQPYAANFRFAKHYLYQFVLDALHRLYEPDDNDAQVQALIHKADVLLARSLQRQAYTLLDKAVELCEQREHLASAVQCYSRQYQIVFQGGFGIEKPEMGRILCQKEAAAAYHLWQQTLMNGLKHRLIARLRQQGNDANEHASEIQQILQEAHTYKPAEDAPSRLRILWHHTMATGYFALQDFPRALEHQRPLVAVYSRFPARVAEMPLNYLSAINNLIILQLELNDVTDIEANLQLLQPLMQGLNNEAPGNLALRAAECAYNLQLRYGLTHDKLSAEFVERTVKPFLTSFDKQLAINQKLNFYLHLAYYYFLNGRITDAQDALMPVLHEIPKDIRTDLHLQARLLEIIIHHRLGNHDLIPYLMEAVLRKAHGKYKEMADAMRTYFSRYLADKSGAGKQLNQALTDYRARHVAQPYIIEKAVMAWAEGM